MVMVKAFVFFIPTIFRNIVLGRRSCSGKTQSNRCMHKTNASSALTVRNPNEILGWSGAALSMMGEWVLTSMRFSYLPEID